mmetsp:Transcript_21094/g.36283  ORF Transcript_21094/g.36283 Transcript_21094/m.36283 type:complete len:80 (-) Transcript_21094:1442-1681(-)
MILTGRQPALFFMSCRTLHAINLCLHKGAPEVLAEESYLLHLCDDSRGLSSTEGLDVAQFKSNLGELFKCGGNRRVKLL